MKRILLFFAFLSAAGFSPSLRASSNLRPTEDALVYRAIDKLIAFHLIDKVIVGHKPWSEKEVRRLMKEAKANIGRAETVQTEIQARKTLKWLGKKFPAAASDSTGVHFHPFAEGEFRYLFLESPERAVPFDVGTLDRIEADINPLLNYTGGRSFHDHHNAFLLSRHRIDFPKHITIVGNTHILFRKDNNTGDDSLRWGFDELYLRGEFKNIGIQTGRDIIAWGPSREGGLFHSVNATPLDMIKIANISPFRYPWIFKHLGPSQISTYFAVMGANRDFPRAYMSGWKFSFLPHRNFEFGFTHAIISGGEGSADASFGKRFADAFGIIGQLAGKDPNISNRIGGFDFTFRIPRWRGISVYYELLFEDTKPLEAWDLMFKDEAVHRIGLYFPKITLSGSDSLRMEFERAGYRAYRHAQYFSGWTRNRRIIGSPLGPDAVSAFIEYEISSTPYFLQRYTLAYEERDSDQYSLTNFAVTLTKTAENLSERRLRFMSRYELQHNAARKWGLTFGYERVHHFNFIPSNNINNFLAEFSLTVYPKVKI